VAVPVASRLTQLRRPRPTPATISPGAPAAPWAAAKIAAQEAIVAGLDAVAAGAGANARAGPPPEAAQPRATSRLSARMAMRYDGPNSGPNCP
jgi:hypothetical protein